MRLNCKAFIVYQALVETSLVCMDAKVKFDLIDLMSALGPSTDQPD